MGLSCLSTLLSRCLRQSDSSELSAPEILSLPMAASLSLTSRPVLSLGICFYPASVLFVNRILTMQKSLSFRNQTLPG